MEKFHIDIIDNGSIPPYLQIDFDGLKLNKDVVQTMLNDTPGVDHVNINDRGIDKHRAIVYPTTYCNSLTELDGIIKDSLKRL